MAIPMIAALAPSILKGLYGLKGMFDYGGAKRPKYEIPQSVNEAEGIYKYLAGADIAGKKEAEAGIFQSQGNILDTLTQNVSSSSALLNAASGIQGQTNKALTDLDIASAQQKAQGTATLANFLQGTKAQYEDKQWQINEYQPFLDEAQAAQKAAENLWGGLKEVGGGLLDIEQANTYKELNKTNQAIQKAWIDKMFPSNTDVTETPNINAQPQNNVTAPVIGNERTIGGIIGGVENINEDLSGENAAKYDAILGIKNAIASKITEAQQEVTNTSNINLASTFLGIPNEIKSVPEVLDEKLGNMTLKDLLSPKSITNNNIDYEEPISSIDEARGFIMDIKHSYSNPYKGNIYESNITKEDILLNNINLSEKDRYGKGNIDLFDRPKVDLGNNGIATVYSKSFNFDGKEVLLPTVRKGLNRQMTDQEAIDWYKKTGEYLGKFNTVEEANDYANKLHLQQQKIYKM